MAEGESPKETKFMKKVRKSDGYDVYTESALARLAARYESSARIEQITRKSSPVKEPKGWRDQFMCMISTRRQKQLHRRDWRSRSVEKERRSHHAKEPRGGNNVTPIPALVLGHPCSHSCSIATVPRLRSLSTIEEHLSAGNRQTHASNRSSRATKEKLKQEKLRSGGNENSRKPHLCHKRSSPTKKRERMMTYPVFQLDPAVPSSHYLGAQNEFNPACRPSVLERLVLKGELLMSSLLRPDPSAENLGFQDLHNKSGNVDENAPKGNLISFNFAVTTAFNVPITGLTFPLLERRVRVCLFDGCNFLGNIHVFPAVTAIEEEDEPWVFVNKGASRCLVQYSASEELSLYIEVNVRYKCAAENDREASEITCAWAIVELPNNQEGVDELVSRSSSELPLLVGSLERPVDVNSVHMPSGNGKAGQVMKTNHRSVPPLPLMWLGRSRVLVKKGGEQSAIHLHWYKLSDFQKKHSRLLPETILASNEEVPFLVLYRKAFLDTLVNDSSLLPGDATFSPLIQLYPWMLNERGKQLQEVFKESWIARKLEWPPNTDCMKEKNRQKYLKGFNTSLLTILPLLQIHNVRQPTWPFNSTFENFKLEDSSDIIGKKIDSEIEKSPVQNNSTDDDCSSSSEDDSDSSGAQSRDE